MQSSSTKTYVELGEIGTGKIIDRNVYMDGPTFCTHINHRVVYLSMIIDPRILSMLY